MQGHLYRLPDGRHCIETQRGAGIAVVVPIIPDWPFPGQPMTVKTCHLKPLPMRYYGGAAPEEIPEAPW